MRLFILGLVMISVFVSCEDEITEENYTDLIELKNLPIITFESDSFDFGTVIEGEKVKHIYKFTNTGDGPLLLSQVNPSCGCTAAENWPRTPIAPGASSQIEVTFDSEGRPGSINKSITVNCNTKLKTKTIKLIGKVVGPTE